MRFFDNLKTKKDKRDYEILLDLAKDLDDVSFKVSILNDKISCYEKNLSLSFDKINNYITKITIAKEKNNLELCKRGFFKYYKETIALKESNQTYNTLKINYELLIDELSSLQEYYSLTEKEYTNRLLENKFFFKNSFKDYTNNFSNILFNMEKFIKTIENTLPSSALASPHIDTKNLFTDENEFLLAFNSFLKEKNLS